MVLSFLVTGRESVQSRCFRDLPYGPHPHRKLDVHAPVGADGEAPVVVLLPATIQGQFSLAFWERRRRAAMGRVLASRGFVVLEPAFDGSVDPDQRLQDAAQACAWAQTRAGDYGGDPQRVFVFGQADGACAAATLALDPRWLGAAGAEGALRGVVGVSGLYDLEPLETHAGAEAPPMLLIAGADGPSVYSTSRLAQARRAVGAPVAEIRYPGLDGRSGLNDLPGVLGRRATPLQEVERFIWNSSPAPAA